MSNQGEGKNTITTNNNSVGKVDTGQYQQEKEDNKHKHKALDNLTLKLRQKQRDMEQLGIDPSEILEEEEKRQPFCQQE
jgi:hypothetical protein